MSGTNVNPVDMFGAGGVTQVAGDCVLTAQDSVRSMLAPELDLAGLSDVQAIDSSAAPYGHECAVLRDGGVRCWGRNNFGQLGNGNQLATSVPVDVVGLGEPVRTVSAGFYHTCAITRLGALKCWGNNSSGQLGNGTETHSPTPVDVQNLGKVTQVAVGSEHTCAVSEQGSVMCWGSSGSGQLGSGVVGAGSALPAQVASLSGVTQLAANAAHVCALTASGGVYCSSQGGADRSLCEGVARVIRPSHSLVE